MAGLPWRYRDPNAQPDVVTVASDLDDTLKTAATIPHVATPIIVVNVTGTWQLPHLALRHRVGRTAYRSESPGPFLTQVGREATLAGMRSVDLKILDNKLSEYVRLAAAGETVLVTDRDRVVAEIVPPRAERSPVLADARLADAVRRVG